MFINNKTVATALGALVFLSQAIPSTASGFGRPTNRAEHARSLRSTNSKDEISKRAGGPECAQADVPQLATEYRDFHTWVNSWLQTGLKEDTATALAQFQKEFSAYDSWMNSWLSAATEGGPAPPQMSDAPLPQATKINSHQGLPFASTIGGPGPYVSVAPFPIASATQGGVGPTGIGSPSQGFPSGSGAYNPSGTGLIGTAPIGTGPIGLPTPSSSGSPSPPSSGSFNAKAKDNVAVYYGQTAATSQVKLTDLCADDSVDIVILSFLTDFAGPGGYPTVNFGAACGASSQTSSNGASGLLSCPGLGSQIKTCQSGGKKVFLSLGGAEAQSAFTSDDQATKFATQLWDLFGAGKGVDAGLRPFGADVKVDGFDIGKFS